ncbi:MAG: DUF2855 family protein [Aeromicrobium sp.]
MADEQTARSTWTLEFEKSDISKSHLVDAAVRKLEPGEAKLRIDRVGVTANNVTYAVLGESFRYWEFFPTESGRGVVPLWGFAEVEESAVDGVAVGDRLYGYLPSASHLIVQPDRIDEQGFRDAREHRATLPSPYNAYALTTGDAAYEADREDLLVLYRPLFWTSYMFADWLDDNDCFGAPVTVLTSASSKTAYGTAFELHRQGRSVVGLTSARNVEFTKSLGCYDRVLTYDQIGQLPADIPTLYGDFLGDGELTAALRVHLRDALVHEVVVGVTQQQAKAARTIAETGPTMFFAPDQMRKRISDWGKDGLEARFAEAWQAFAQSVEGWVDVVVSEGPEALQRVWLEVQSGLSDPRTGNILSL